MPLKKVLIREYIMSKNLGLICLQRWGIGCLRYSFDTFPDTNSKFLTMVGIITLIIALTIADFQKPWPGI